MDALLLRVALVVVTLFVSTGASHRTRNFVVTASTSAEARQVAEAAEEYRRRLAIFWTGKALPNWSSPCTIRVKSGSYGAAGQTTFQFFGRTVRNWRMSVQGTPQRILDSVLPHEVNHTIFACLYRRPLPRWADEGAATLFEDHSEQRLQLDLLQRVVNNRREFIPLRDLLSMKQYPSQHRPMLILYAEGFGLVDFLMQQAGRRVYLDFLKTGHRDGWEAAIRQHYNHGGIEALEKDWRAWINAGMPRYGTSPEEMIASMEGVVRDVARPASSGERARRRSNGTQVRGQSPEPASRKAAEGQFRPAEQKRQLPSAPAADSPRPAADRVLTAPAPQVRSRDHRMSQAGPSESRSSWTYQQQPGLQPTTHQESPDDRPRTSARSNPWKRKVKTGTTPQWAGFPGQAGLF